MSAISRERERSAATTKLNRRGARLCRDNQPGDNQTDHQGCGKQALGQVTDLARPRDQRAQALLLQHFRARADDGRFARSLPGIDRAARECWKLLCAGRTICLRIFNTFQPLSEGIARRRSPDNAIGVELLQTCLCGLAHSWIFVQVGMQQRR